MKKTLLLVVCLLLNSTLAIGATLVSGARYRIVCAGNEGQIVLGANHGSTAQIYCDVANDPSGGYPDDAWWVITESGKGSYTLMNAKSGEYMMFDSERVETEKKGISMTTMSSGTSVEWAITETTTTGVFHITSIESPTNYMNVRKDGSNLVGTYTNTGGSAANEKFYLYNESGERVEGSGAVAPSPNPEATGPGSLIVVSAPNATNAQRYSIRNFVSGNYAYYSYGNYDRVQQVSNATNTAQWVLVNAGEMADGILPVKLWNVEAQMYINDVESYNYTWFKNNSTTWYLSYQTDPTSGASGFAISKSAIPYTNKKTFWNNYNGEGKVIGLWSVDESSLWSFEVGKEFGSMEQSGPFSTYVDSLCINGKTLVYDYHHEQYMYSLPTALQNGGDFEATFTFKSKNATAGYTFDISGAASAATGVLTLNDPDGTQTYTLTLKNNGTEVSTAQLAFTFLPIVEIQVSYNCNGDTYTEGRIAVHDGDNTAPQSDSVYHAKFRHRGATAQSKNKKAYAVKIIDGNGASLDAKFLDLRNDNNWILDAMAVDPACMRNRVSTDLWNDFASKPYYSASEKKARTGTRGKFVEVIQNGKYHGLYCMTEKLDRKQMKLKKFSPAATPTEQDTLHGLLYKTNQWNYEVLMGVDYDNLGKVGFDPHPGKAPNEFSNYSEKWESHEIKYPDVEDGEVIDWGPMWNAVNFVATSTDREFESDFELYFNQNTVSDYYLFIELLLATDNHGKNLYWGVYDKQDPLFGNKMELAVWDLDGVFGRNYYGSSSYTQAEVDDFMQFLWDYEHAPSYLFTRLLASKYLNMATLLPMRYAELRETHFDEASLIKRFTDYGNLFAASGADTREESRWPEYHSDILGDVAYTTQWISERIATLDSIYNYTPIAQGIDHYVGENPVTIKGGKGTISLFSTQDRTVNVYSENGKMLRQVQLGKGIVTIDDLSSGIYLVEDKKVLVK